MKTCEVTNKDLKKFTPKSTPIATELILHLNKSQFGINCLGAVQIAEVTSHAMFEI